MFNEVALEAWLTIDSCYLIGWNQKKIPAGIPRGITASGSAALGRPHNKGLSKGLVYRPAGPATDRSPYRPGVIINHSAQKSFLILFDEKIQSNSLINS